MLIGRRNYLRIVHAGFVCRNGGFHVSFYAAGTTKSTFDPRFQSEGGRRERTTSREKERERERENDEKKWQKVTRNNERYRSANMAVARRLGKSLLSTLSPQTGFDARINLIS